MRAPATRIATLLLCGACALALLTAIAFAAPATRSSNRHGGTRPRPCQERVRPRGRKPERLTHCRPRRRPAHPPLPAPSNSPTAGAPPAAPTPPSSAGPTSPGVASPTPVAPTPVPAPSESEAPMPPPSIPRVQVTAVEYAFTLSRATVPAGRVIFELVNHGQDEHNLNVAPEQGALAGSFANTPADSVVDQEIELRPGTYTLFCSLHEHESRGMKATLLVE